MPVPANNPDYTQAITTQVNNQPSDSELNSDSAAVPPPTSDYHPRIFRLIMGFLIMLSIIFLVIGAYMWYQVLAPFPVVDSQSSPSDSTVTPVTINPGVITIGIDATYPPMEYINDQGDYVGYDIDLGNRIAEKLNLQANFISYSWDALFEALQNGEVDVIISSVTITDERSQIYDFSNHYLNAGQVIVVPESETSIATPQDLQGKIIAVQDETTSLEEAVKLTDSENILKFENYLLVVDALLNGQADATIADLTGAKGIVTDNSGLKIASDPFTSEYYGIVFKKGNQQLLDQINNILDSLRQQGILVLLKQKWLE